MDRIILGRRGVRAGLIVLALPQLAIGAWALISPSGWYEGFPGAGREWLPLYGSFDEHLASDVGSTFLALGLILVLAAIWMDRRLVIAAAAGYLVYQLPHAIFHWANDGVLSSGDQIANGIALGLSVFLAIGILVGAMYEKRRPASRGSDPEGTGRLGPSPGGLLARFSRSYAKRRYGGELAPTDAYLHTPGLLLGYGAFEIATERATRVPERLKLLAELRAAQVVGCEWCMDFGSMLGRAHGLPERQLTELALWESSDAFSDDERLVIEYATEVSRTPTGASDEVFARLRERFGDAELVELTNAIAIENLRARFNHALGLEPQGFSDGAACVVPDLAAAQAGRIVNGGDRQPRAPDAV